jgi:hypothetical protein
VTQLARSLVAPVARAGALCLATALYLALLIGLSWEVHAPTWFLLVAGAVTPLAAWLRGRRELAALGVAGGGALLTALLPDPEALAAGGVAVLALLALLAPVTLELAEEALT